MKNEASEKCQNVSKGTVPIIYNQNAACEIQRNSLIVSNPSQADEDFEVEAAEMLNWKHALAMSLASYNVNCKEIDRSIDFFAVMPEDNIVSHAAKDPSSPKE